MNRLFVAGAGTDIGKTHVACALVRGRRSLGRSVLALKPVASGVGPVDEAAFAESDTARLLAAQGLAATPAEVDGCSPWRFAAPLSPDMAAQAEGRRLLLPEVVDWCRRRIAGVEADVLIEGVGGVMSPATEDALNLDWAAALDCPVLLVGGTYLGAISHVLTALEVVRARGLPLAGLVLNEATPGSVGLEATAQAVGRFGGVTPWLSPYGGSPPTEAWPL
jgi:dethiobiotin synthetase